jgi:UDP-glucose 4-epimerase
MAIVVTGGAGYIGSLTVARLRSDGRDVVVLDNMEFGHAEAVTGVPLIQADVADTETVTQVVGDHHVDAVIHFAAYKAAGESMGDPGRYFANNVGSTNALLDTLRRVGVERFVFSSTCAVYGTPDRLPVDETLAIRPESPYGESKALVERILHWYGVAHGTRSVSLRYFNAAGAALDGQMGEDWTYTLNLVPLVMKALLGRIPGLQVFGTDYPTPDGTNIRDYVHVVDLAEAHLRALEHLEKGGETTAVNLGTGKGSSVLEVIDAARRASGLAIEPTLVGRRPGDPVSLYADNSRARTLLGWEPRYGLDEIVASAWRWHSTHPDGYGTHPDGNGTHPDGNGTHPDGNGTHPDGNGTHPDGNGTHPDGNGTVVDTPA